MSNRATSSTAKPPLYKIVMLGDSGVGKTSLVARLTNPNAPLNHDISATMGIEFDTQMLDTPHGKVKAQIWDTAGQERFARVLLPTYFRKAKGVILVYDITSSKSFESLSERWMVQLNDHANSDDLAKLLVGNKCDLCPPDNNTNGIKNDGTTTTNGQQQQQQQYTHSREVTRNRAHEFCTKYNMEYLETSAKNGNNVLQSFERLITIVHEKNLAVRGSGSSGNSGGGGKLGSSSGNMMGGGSGSGGGRGGGYDNTDHNGSGTLKLDEGNVRGDGDNASSSCGC
jgi:small GTP-binding protein